MKAKLANLNYHHIRYTKAPDLICQSGAFPYNMISNFSGWGYGLISFLYRPSAVNKY